MLTISHCSFPAAIPSQVVSRCITS